MASLDKTIQVHEQTIGDQVYAICREVMLTFTDPTKEAGGYERGHLYVIRRNGEMLGQMYGDLDSALERLRDIAVTGHHPSPVVIKRVGPGWGDDES